MAARGRPPKYKSALASYMPVSPRDHAQMKRIMSKYSLSAYSLDPAKPVAKAKPRGK